MATTNTLDNFSLYLWDNPEGYHITVTTNYNTSTEKRSFFSFGKQTYKSWRAFNLHQPEPLKEFFSNFKEQNKSIKEVGRDYWISKLAVNTGTKGRRTAPGAMILIDDNGTFTFKLNLAQHAFSGEFMNDSLSEAQRKGAKGVCLGCYIWKEDTEINDYAEAF
jgi:hypothetical protein